MDFCGERAGWSGRQDRPPEFAVIGPARERLAVGVPIGENHQCGVRNTDEQDEELGRHCCERNEPNSWTVTRGISRCFCRCCGFSSAPGVHGQSLAGFRAECPQRPLAWVRFASPLHGCRISIADPVAVPFQLTVTTASAGLSATTDGSPPIQGPREPRARRPTRWAHAVTP